MVIKVIDKEKLEQELLQYLKQVIELRNTFRLYKMMKNDINGSLNKVNKYPYVFVTTINALIYSFIMQAYKLFTEKEKKNIFSMIEICKNNQKHFENPEELVKKLNKLKKYLETKIDTINNIRGLRDKYFAHSDKKYFSESGKLMKDFIIETDEIEEMIEETYCYIKNIYSMIQPIMILDWVEEMEKDWKRLLNQL